MGKGKKRKRQGDTLRSRSDLGDEIVSSANVTKRRSQPVVRLVDNTEQDEEASFVDADLSRKIIKEAKKQQSEVEGVSSSTSRRKVATAVRKSVFKKNDASSDEDDEEVGEGDAFDGGDIEVDSDDEAALDRFMLPSGTARRTLGDIIADKLTEKQTEINEQLSDAGSLIVRDMDPRVVDMYKKIGSVLARYRSGKLPKAFKVVPSMVNWEQILYLLEPDSWSAAAVLQATRVFASNLNARLAQRFYNLVLLPRIRDDIAEYKKLNYHLYQALRKSLYKPAAFFKGILIPLAESGTCTLREAVIISSVLAKNSVPMLHSAAALLFLAEMEYSGAASLFIRTLLEKRYALPYRVIDALVHHFLRFEHDERQLPVLWHQALLALTTRYGVDLSGEQRDAILALVSGRHTHHLITTEIKYTLKQAATQQSERFGAERVKAPSESMDCGAKRVKFSD